MAKQSRTTLKTYFNRGDKPTEDQFSDTIDSFLNLSVTGTEALTGSLTLNTVSQSFSLSGSQAYSEVKFSNLPTTLAQARLMGSGSLYVSGSTVNGGGKVLYVFTG